MLVGSILVYELSSLCYTATEQSLSFPNCSVARDGSNERRSHFSNLHRICIILSSLCARDLWKKVGLLVGLGQYEL